MPGKKLNLGCGSERKEGFIGIDIRNFGQEIIRDITKGLPFDDNSVDEIYSCHFFEHLNGDDVRWVLKECWRVLKKNCEIFIRVPHSHDDTAFYPDHKSYWNELMVNALFNDPAQKGNYDFEILQNQREGAELHIKLKKL